MKKILTILVAVVLTLPAWGKFEISTLGFYFAEHGSAPFGETCSGITYSDEKTLLVQNETFRALAVWWDGSESVEDDDIPFELNAQGEPVPVSGAESAAFVWMETTTFKNEDGIYPTYVAVGTKSGIAGKVYMSGYPFYYFTFSLNKGDVETTLSSKPEYEEYKNAEKPYRVYFITQDTRNAENIVSAPLSTPLVKWNATLVKTCTYNTANHENFAVNFNPPNNAWTEKSILSPTRLPYGVEPESEIVFPDDPSEDVKIAAIEALEAALDEKVYATITKIKKPEVGAAINGIITGPGTIELDETETGTVATFTYDFKVTEISFGESGITVTVALGTDQTFAQNVAVTLTDLDGAEITATETKVEGGVATVTIPISTEVTTRLFKAKATKVDQESVDEE